MKERPLCLASLGIQSRGDIHTPQLLEEQFCSIRQVDLTDLVLVITVFALKSILFELRNHRHQPADVADMYTEGVRDVEEAFFEEGRRAMCDHAIALHFAEAETTVTRPTFNRLAG